MSVEEMAQRALHLMGMRDVDNDADVAAIANEIRLAMAQARTEALEEAARWHEERAARVEHEAQGPVGAFLADQEREYIAERAAVHRIDAEAIRALAAGPL